jgi:uncharacterized membrane protein
MFFLPADLRVSDADRDAAVEFLNRHYAAGRLTDDELSARIDAAHAARYDSQLEALTDDLPALPPARIERRGAGRRVGPTVAVAAVAVVALATAGAVPPDAWAMLLGLVVPLILMLLFTVAPVAVPLLAFAWIAHALTRPASRQLPRGGGGRSPRTYGRWADWP